VNTGAARVSLALAHRHSARNEFSSPAQRRLVLAGRREITQRVLELDVQHFVADMKCALDEIFKLLVPCGSWTAERVSHPRATAISSSAARTASHDRRLRRSRKRASNRHLRRLRLPEASGARSRAILVWAARRSRPSCLRRRQVQRTAPRRRPQAQRVRPAHQAAASRRARPRRPHPCGAAPQ
jgi:hypothetical protein